MHGEYIIININHKGETLSTVIDKTDLRITDDYEGTWSGSQYKKDGTIYVTSTDHNKGNPISLKLHRLITGANKGELVDHINGNGLDNRRSNLRVCGYEGNARNSRVKSTNTSGFPGVSYRKDRGKWRSYITIDGKQNNLGMYKTYEEAKLASIKGREKYYKEYSITNRYFNGDYFCFKNNKVKKMEVDYY